MEYTKEEIAKKIVKKASDNGWIGKAQWIADPKMYIDTIIFDISFAKVFFGESKVFVIYSSCLKTENHNDGKPKFDSNTKYDNSCYVRIPAYKYHLQQMIVEEDRIKYLKKFL